MTIDQQFSLWEGALLVLCACMRTFIGVRTFIKHRDMDNVAWMVVDLFLVYALTMQFIAQLDAPPSGSSLARGAVLLYFISGIIADAKNHMLRRKYQ